MTDYQQIFKEIVDILHHDYAGYQEKTGWDEPAYYIERIEQLMTEDAMTPFIFSNVVNDYLMAFQDQHMSFSFNGSDDVKAKYRGFRTRRCDEVLIVIETVEENRFPVGSQIITIDGQTISQIIATNRYFLSGISAEREDWMPIFNQSSWIEVEYPDGTQASFELRNYEAISINQSPSIKELDNNTIYLHFPSFMNVNETLDFVKKVEGKICSCHHLIIDVRDNHGGNGKSYSTLMPYLFRPGEHPPTTSELKEFNYTNRNADLFIQLCQRMAQQVTDEKTLELFASIEEDCEKYRGQGFVLMDFSEELAAAASTFTGHDYPINVIVMTDVYCASAAEYFVETCQSSSKTTVIGRATMGVNDYSDLVVKSWGQLYSLYYPISRRVNQTPNDPLHGKGIQPDHYIPWTPQHLKEDVDLLYALEFLKNNER